MILHKRTRHDCTFALQPLKSKKREHFLERISWQWFEHYTVSTDLRVIANTPSLDNRKIAANGQFTTDSPQRSATNDFIADILSSRRTPSQSRDYRQGG